MNPSANRVELIYDADCPNVAQTRSLLVAAVFFSNRTKSVSNVSCPACVTGGNEKQVQAR